MFQLHLGAFTLRLAPEALSSLVATLSEAVAAGAVSFALEASNDQSGRWSPS
jgi:hypothetical protein